MKIEVIKCDGCGTIIDDPRDAYRMKLAGSTFWSGDCYEQLEVDLHFCLRCANDLKRRMQIIAGVRGE